MKSIYPYLLVTLFLSSLIPNIVRAGTYTVGGTVTTSGKPVRYASVVFFNSYDLSIRYSAVTDSEGNFTLSPITAVKPEPQLPRKFQLNQNYPNPFSSSTAISYNLKKQSNVEVTIYDVLGRKIRTFDAGSQAAGTHGVIWNGRNNVGKLVAPGVYFYRLEAGGEAQVKKMVFGVGGGTNSVLLSGSVSQQTKSRGDAVQGVPAQLLSGGESFVVQISNTDSTYPTIAPRLFGPMVIQSDTTLGFSINLPHAFVYLDSTRQIIRGFGAANIAGSQDGLIDIQVPTAYGTGPSELGLTIMRLSIPTDSTQFVVNVPTALAAEKLGATIIATPWTPPAWMKTNDNVVGGSLKQRDYGAYATFLRSFADTMSSYGVSLYAISVQNEPDATVTYVSCHWNATQLLEFMKNYAPSVGVPIFMPESENFNHQLSDSTLNDSVADSHVAFIAGHIYGVTPTPYPLAMKKGKEVWMTEHYTNEASANDWSQALPVGKEINDCMNADMSAYVWWYVVSSYGLMDQLGVPTKRGYIMSQYAEFVRPGFYRVSATANPMASVYVTAYKDSSKVAVVVLNMASVSLTMPFTLQGGTASSFTPYVTSSDQNRAKGSAVAVSNDTFTVTLEPSSVTTFVSN